ncbi:MAG: histidine--tRNA ligase [Pyrinomonadaceae bacterium]
MGKTQPARGMRDFLPADVRRRDYVIKVIKEVYERYGFEPLETPAVENIETLTGKYGEEAGQLIFKILRRGEGEKTGEADLALRYDLTVPLARVVAEHRERLPKFFKRYQIQPVWRADRPARGRFREFYQCDVDVLGSTSMTVEAELCAAADEVLLKLGFNDFTIRLNHRQILTGVLEEAGVSPEKHADTLVALDKLDKIGIQGVEHEFAARGIDYRAGQRLIDFFAVKSVERSVRLAVHESGKAESEDYNADVINRIVGFVRNHEGGARGVEELQQIIKYANASGVGQRIKVDPSLARGLSYYTGAIMEISVPDLAGSLGGGGRYDNLVGMFSNREVPACGFSLGLERIIVVMTEKEMFPKAFADAAPADVMVAIWDEESTVDALRLARELRTADLRVELYPEADKLKNQFKYASTRGVRFVLMVGADEKARGEVALKDMQTGEQQAVRRDAAGATLIEKLKTVTDDK